MNRRTILKAAGISLLLPPLESFGEVKEKKVKRLFTLVNHLSFYQPELLPQKTGSFDKVPVLLENLREHFNDLKVYGGFDNPSVQLGLGHTPCVGILSGYFNKLQRKNRISVDQAAADLLGHETRFKSLVFQAGQNLNFSQVSWDKHGLPVHQLDNPKNIFNLLFQIEENRKEQQRVLAEEKSILDLVFKHAKSMEKKLNNRDKSKIDEYFTSVREVEKSVKKKTHWSTQDKPVVDYKMPVYSSRSVEEYLQVMLDLSVLALETDSSRAVTIQIPFWEGFKQDNISGSYHDFSHHGKKPAKIKKLLVMENMILKKVSETMTKMKSTSMGSGSLFDETTTLVAASMGNASAHTFNDLPALVFAKGMKNPGYENHEKKPMSNLYLSILKNLGAEMNSFGDSKASMELV
ncbi:MAG: DUF1552 domain-containing protein [Lentisphaeraceae bacterium]|nr:DUF1552 domain-containing protein [Lentisphaeraceae bacterium]